MLSHKLRDLETLSWEFVLLACLAAHLGDAETGALLIGETEAVRDLGASVLTGAEAELYRTTLAQLRVSLGDERLDILRARGRVMTLDEAVEYALASIN